MPRAAARTSSSACATGVLVAVGAHSLARRSACWRCSAGSIGNTSGSDVVVLDEAVHADDHALAVVDRLRVLVGGRLDLVHLEAGLDRGDRATHLVDAVEVLPGLGLDLVGERLDEVRAAERVGGVDDARLVPDDLLRAQRDLRGALGRQAERLVEAVRVQRLRAAQHRGQRLQRDAHDVVLGLLRGERRAAGLGVEAQQLATPPSWRRTARS